MENYIIFNHGKESGPWGSKISALAEVARKHNFSVDSVDYEGIYDPGKRVQMLLEFCRSRRPAILVGSSMGGYVAATASETIKPDGLFLMAPAFGIPSYELNNPKPVATYTSIVHGWNDEIVPVDNVLRYAKENNCTLTVLDAGHTLNERLGEICIIFDAFIGKIAKKN